MGIRDRPSPFFLAVLPENHSYEIKTFFKIRVHIRLYVIYIYTYIYVTGIIHARAFTCIDRKERKEKRERQREKEKT